MPSPSGSALILTAQLALTSGTRLGVYEISAPIGEGGMGQVYRATDTTLGRQVAIKILPDAFAGDAERLARFEREAKTLASLNHPHIAAIYGFEKSAGMSALAMELVEGEDLSQRIAGSAIPIDEALTIARQIAEALDAAHEQGIVHRDLKPANIKLRADGTVKVLDFGLARSATTGGTGADALNSPTFTSPAALTMGGMILGTAAYMAPEQARGKTVDKRTDIWAFGLVLYEMLVGRIAFAGDTISDVLAAVLTREPDWTALPATTPASIKRLLARCLEKDPKRRLRDIGDARLEIEETIRDPIADPSPVAAAPRVQPFAWTAAGFAVAATVIAGLAASGVWPRARISEARPLRLSIVHTEGSEVGAPAISPDGRRVAYRARRSDGMPLLWVRDLASSEAQPLAGTEDASLPFWSPDSSDLGFFSGVSLKRVSAVGGPVRILVDYMGTYPGAGGTWSSDGTIVFSGQFDLFRVPANGGAVSIVTKAPTQDWSYYWPTFLPDGRRFLFTAKLWTRTAEASDQGIYIGSLDNSKIERLLPDLSSAVYAPPGYLVFARNGTLTALPFDLAAGRVTGSPVPIGGAVAMESQFYFAGISASADGTLAVWPPPALTLSSPGMNAAQTELHLVDRGGRGSRVSSARLFSFTMAFSPVDSRVAAAAILDLRGGTSDLWLVDLTKDTAVPLTTTRGFASYPVWSAAGKRMAYAYQPPGGMDDVYVTDIASGGIAPLIEHPGRSSTRSPGPMTNAHCSPSPTTTRGRTCHRGRSLAAYSLVWSVPECSTPGHSSRRATTSLPTRRRSQVVLRSTSPRFPSIGRRGRSRPAAARRSAGGRMEARSSWRRSRDTSRPIRSRPRAASHTASRRRSFAISAAWPYTRSRRQTTAACSFASARTRHKTRARCGCSLAGRTACASATTDD
jgi:Tol biopolymer transport system component